jgi:transposase
MRPTGSPEALEVRRRLAVGMLLDGYEPAEAAAAVGADPSSVRRWRARHAAGGEGALAAVPATGRPPKLTAGQAGRLLAWVRDGRATDFGFDTPRWTAPRVAAVAERELGVRLHPRYLNAWLGRRGISPQLPQRVPRERDDAAVARWVAEDWPRIKRGRGRRARRSRSRTRAGC